MKTFRLFSMAALALVMAACGSDDNVIEQQPAQQQAKMHFTATIEAPNSGATTRTTYTEDGTTINVAWKNGDQIALIHNGVKDVVTVGTPNPDGSAPISGTITVGTDGEDVVLAYPAAAVSSATPYGMFPFTANPTCWDKAHTQDGTLEFIQNNIDFRMGSGKLSVSGDPATASLKANVKMPSMISIWKLTLQDNTSAALSATAVTVKAGGELVAGATSTAKSAYYLCMVPSFIHSGDLVIEATVGSDTYTYTKAGGVSLETSKYYQSTVTMTKQLTYPIALSAVTSDYVGSVVTTDGNVYPAKTAVPAGKTAVGILGKVTATGHGLILALQDAATQQTWTTINSWTSVDTYADTTLKLFPNNTARSPLTSYTTLGSTTVSNWCVAQKSDYEAIFINLGSTTVDTNGTTYDANVNAYITTGVGGTDISVACWSATNSYGSKSWIFGSLGWNPGSAKGTPRNLRPVLGF